MSASTVAITANPSAAVVSNSNPSLAIGSSRRRNVIVTEKRSSNIEMVSEGGGGIDGNESGRGRELSHSIRGAESVSVLEISKDIVNSALNGGKKRGDSAVSPRRGRKVGTRVVEKALWKTILSVVTKNSLLVLFVLGLFQMFYNSFTKHGLVAKNGDGNVVIPMSGMLELEGRIADVEASMKTTTKMIQVQVEVVNRKIESEVGGLRRELTKKVDEKGSFLENELKKLVERTDGIDTSLSELKSSGLLTKGDLETFLNELKNSRADEEKEKDWSLDEIRSVARDIVEKEIEKHAADGLGRVDYALYSAGAAVVGHSEPYYGGGKTWFSKKLGSVCSDAAKMLTPSFGEPGQCFALKGGEGFVTIRLRTTIIPEAITLEHISKSVSFDRSSAPKDCLISGWFQTRELDQIHQNRKILTQFTYDLEKSNAQTFNVDSFNVGVVNTVRLDFSSNHGAPHTCIYRLRVHGKEPQVSPLLPLDS